MKKFSITDISRRTVLGLIVVLVGCAEQRPVATTGAVAPAVQVAEAAPAPGAESPSPAPPPTPAVIDKVAAQTKDLPPSVKAVADLAQAGIGNTAILAYVQNSPGTFDLTADQIVYLSDLGVSPETIAAMIRHGKPDGDAPTAAQVAAMAQQSTTPAPPATTPAPVAVQDQLVPQVPVQPAPVVVEQPAPVVTQPAVSYNYFYTDLAPYGSWYNMAEYGWVWQPTCVTVDPGWRPYSHRGHWLWTDAGWYWQSDYSWGWAPFHYGRWLRHGTRGWVWCPDTTWGPAWVAWREHDINCGWAPLPPGAVYTAAGFTFHGASVSVGFDFGLSEDCFTFVPYRHFYHRNPWQYALARNQVHGFFDRSRPINHITINDNRVINIGVSADRVATASRTEIHKVHLQDIDAGRVHGRREVLSAEGNSLAVYRPKLPMPDLPADPSRGKEHILNGRNENPRSERVANGSTPVPVGSTRPAQTPPPTTRTFANRSGAPTTATTSTESRQTAPLSNEAIQRRIETRAANRSNVPEYAQPRVAQTPPPASGNSATVNTPNRPNGVPIARPAERSVTPPPARSEPRRAELSTETPVQTPQRIAIAQPQSSPDAVRPSNLETRPAARPPANYPAQVQSVAQQNQYVNQPRSYPPQSIPNYPTVPSQSLLSPRGAALENRIATQPYSAPAPTYYSPSPRSSAPAAPAQNYSPRPAQQQAPAAAPPPSSPAPHQSAPAPSPSSSGNSSSRSSSSGGNSRNQER